MRQSFNDVLTATAFACSPSDVVRKAVVVRLHKLARRKKTRTP
jgi:hypothetical protein